MKSYLLGWHQLIDIIKMSWKNQNNHYGQPMFYKDMGI